MLARRGTILPITSICAVVRASTGLGHAGVTSNSELTVVKVHHRRGSVVPTVILFIFHLKHQHRLFFSGEIQCPETEAEAEAAGAEAQTEGEAAGGGDEGERRWRRRGAGMCD